MQRRILGSSGIEVSAIGLGCWGMSGSYGPADEAESIATLHHALDLGITLIDTADSYGDGHNESLIGRALGARRHEFVLASKTGWVKRAGPDGKEIIGVDGRPRRIRSACEASLARLKTDATLMSSVPAGPRRKTVTSGAFSSSAALIDSVRAPPMSSCVMKFAVRRGVA